MNKKIIFYLFIFFYLYSCTSLKTKKNIAVDYYNLGNKYYNNEDYKNAIECYQKSLDYDPKSKETIMNLIISYQKNEEYEKAQRNIFKYYRKKNDDFNKKLLMLLGNNFFLQLKFPQAIKVYNTYLETYTNDANCYFNLGLTYLKLSDTEKAVKFFIKAYEVNKKHIPSIYNIGEYYFNKKEYSKSLIYFSELETLDKNNPEIFYKLGLIEFYLEEYEHSKNHLLKAFQIDSNNNDFLILLARLYSKGYNNKDKTIEYLEKAFENDFDDINYIQSLKEFNLLIEYDNYKKLLTKYGLK